MRYRTKWRLALDMLDEAIDDWGLAARPVVADADYGGITEFRRALAERGLNYIVAVKASTSVQTIEAEITTRPWSAPGARHNPATRTSPPISARWR